MDSIERADYHKQIEDAQSVYYENNRKKSVFKYKQKMECAQQVTNDFDVKKMIDCTAFIVPNKNAIYFNYLVFKLYGNDSNQRELYESFKGLIQQILEKFDTFEVHVNLKSFTISACQRYYNLITSSFNENTLFTDKLSKMVIYNTPTIVNQITSLLYTTVKDVLPKTEYYYKNSDTKIKELFDFES